MAQKGDVELVIRAKNDATKSLDKITASLKALTDQQTIAGDAATKADSQLGALGQELAKLQTNAKNLKSVADIASVLDTATAALKRQKGALNDAVVEQGRLEVETTKLAAKQTDVTGKLAAATTALDKQTKATETAKASASTLGKEVRTLATQQGTLERSLGSVQKLMGVQSTALGEAQEKYRKLATEVENTKKPTKRLTNSLEAAERALTKKNAALTASKAKERELQGQLTANKAAQEKAGKAAGEAAQNLKKQQDATVQAKAAVAALKTESSSLGQSQRKLSTELASAGSSVDKLRTQLIGSQQEYGKVQQVAQQARAAVSGQATSSNEAAAAAGRAAAQLATLAGRMSVLRSAGTGGTSAFSLNVNPAGLQQSIMVMQKASSVIAAAGNEATAASVSAEKLQAALTAVGNTKSQLSGLANAVSAQKNAVSGAQAAWTAAEAEVKRLALAMRAADAPSDELASAFGRAQAQARLAKTEFVNQRAAAGELDNALRRAGVSAGGLASAEASLKGSIASANSALAQGAAVARTSGVAMGDAGGRTSGLKEKLGSLVTGAQNTTGRIGQLRSVIKALGDTATNVRSPLGGMSSELKSMAVAAGGLYALKEGIEGIIKTSNEMEAAGSRFRVAFGGDVKAADTEMQFAVETAKNLKLPIIELVKNYSQLATAARGTKMEGQGARDVFVAFAQAARVNRNTSDELKGSFNALTQIMSKGKVQAEELRGQLGDRFPGAIQIMASALGVSTTQLDKMMSLGQLTSDTLRNMAAEVSKRVAPELANALDSPQAKMQAFDNQITQLKLTLANSGFLEAFGNAAQKLANALATPEAIQGAKDLGKALGDMVDYVSNLNISLDDVKTALKTFMGYMIAQNVVSFGAGIVTLTTGFVALAPAIWAALAPLLPFAAIIGLIALALAAPFVAKWAYENFPTFAKLCLETAGVAKKAWNYIGEAWDIVGAALGNSFEQVINNIKASWAKMLSWVAESASGLLKKVGMGDWADELASQAQAAQQKAANSQKAHEAELSAIHAKAVAERAAIDVQTQKDIEAQLAKIAGKGKPDDKKKPQNVQATPTGSTAGLGQVGSPGEYKADPAIAAAAAAKKRLAMEKQLASEMYAIRSQLAKKSADTLQEQLDAVPAKYAKIYDQLRALGRSHTSEEWKTVDALVAQEQAQVRVNFAKAETKKKAAAEREAEKQINDMLSLRRDLLEQIKYAEGKGDYTTADRLKAQYDGLNAKLKEAIANQIAYWENVGGDKADLAIAKLKATSDSLENVKSKAIVSAQTIGGQLGQSLNGFGDSFLSKIAETGDVFGSLKDAFRDFASSFLLQIAKMILQQALFNALQSAAGAAGGGIWGSVFGAAASSVSSAHTGGIAGSPTLNKRTVNPGIFANATKYHTGGVVGLQPWEVPIVAKKNEEVLTADDPRHINNYGRAGNSTNSGNGNNSVPNFQIINAIDADEVVQKGLSSPAGTKSIMNLIQANRSKIKGLIG